jgi:hypothetical protein
MVDEEIESEIPVYSSPTTTVKDLWVISKKSLSGITIYYHDADIWGGLDNASYYDKSAQTEIELETNESWVRLIDAAMI